MPSDTLFWPRQILIHAYASDLSSPIFIVTQVGKVELEADKIRVSEKAEEMPEGFEFPTTQEGCRDRMLEINQHVKDVSVVR